MYQNLGGAVGRVVRVGLLLCAVAVVWAGLVGVGRAAGLPDGRGYELVSPPAKNGGSVVADTQRTRAAPDGSAVGFAALTAFGDAIGTGIATDYMAVRDVQGTADAGNGWSTHAMTPLQSGGTYDAILSILEPFYVGEFTPDLTGGVFAAQSPLTSDPWTAQVPNLYLRADLRTPGAGSYALITGCPLCASRARALPAMQLVQNAVTASELRPYLAGMSPDGQHVAFESRQALTADAPASISIVKLYEWDQGTVRLAGRIPPAGSSACDDSTQAPACVPSSASQVGAGAGVGIPRLVAHVVSDGSDGHTHVIFGNPSSGLLYMRTDGTSTVQLNVSERTVADTPAPASYLDASADGERVFFLTRQALTNDALVNTFPKLYMYDATQPAGSRLTLLSGANAIPVDGTIGTSADGHYVYFLAEGQLVGGQPVPETGTGIFLWHDGTLRYVGPAPFASFQAELYSGGTDPTLKARQARVTPDGRYLLFSTESGAGLGGYDQGVCSGGGCRELYVYSADTGTVACASCNPSGAPATAMATDQVRAINGASQTSVHQNESITDDGTRVFFSTAEALVPEDVNGRSDAYEWTANGTHGCASTNPLTNGCITLLSTGTSTEDSWFMDASKTGDDAFFITDQQLLGWDTDQAYDLYDARVDGGWPPPPPTPTACAGDACQNTTLPPPLIQPNASSTFHGSGNLNQTLKARPKPKPRPLKCRKGYVKKRVRGKTKCVKRPRPKPKARRAKRARATANRGRS